MSVLSIVWQPSYAPSDRRSSSSIKANKNTVAKDKVNCPVMQYIKQNVLKTRQKKESVKLPNITLEHLIEIYKLIYLNRCRSDLIQLQNPIRDLLQAINSSIETQDHSLDKTVEACKTQIDEIIRGNFSEAFFGFNINKKPRKKATQKLINSLLEGSYQEQPVVSPRVAAIEHKKYETCKSLLQSRFFDESGKGKALKIGDIAKIYTDLITILEPIKFESSSNIDSTESALRMLLLRLNNLVQSFHSFTVNTDNERGKAGLAVQRSAKLVQECILNEHMFPESQFSGIKNLNFDFKNPNKELLASLKQVSDITMGILSGRVQTKTASLLEAVQAQLKRGAVRQISIGSGGSQADLPEVKNATKYSPRPYQESSVKAIMDCFNKGNERQTAVIPCGEGKSYTAFLVKEAIKKQIYEKTNRAHNPMRSLVFVPTLQLLEQFMEEWSSQEKPDEASDYLIICSQRDIDKLDDQISALEQSEEADSGHLINALVSLRSRVKTVSSDANDIAVFLNKPSDKEKIIYSTYQSSQKIIDALQNVDEQKKSFDFICCDEAHRTTGEEDSLFTKVHNNEKLPSSRRLNMTATKKLFDLSFSQGFQTRVSAFDMSDEKIYGPTSVNRKFSQAIEDGNLVDYELFFIHTDPIEIEKFLNDNEIEINEDNIKLASRHLALKKAYDDCGAKKTISYHQYVDTALDFASDHRMFQPKLTYFSVHGAMTAQERNANLNAFKRSTDPCAISNVVVLREGTNIPSADTCFMDTQINAVGSNIQTMSRVLRKDPNNKAKVGKIIIPLLGNNARNFFNLSGDLKNDFKDTDESRMYRAVEAIAAMDSRFDIQHLEKISDEMQKNAEGDATQNLPLEPKYKNYSSGNIRFIDGVSADESCNSGHYYRSSFLLNRVSNRFQFARQPDRFTDIFEAAEFIKNFDNGKYKKMPFSMQQKDEFYDARNKFFTTILEEEIGISLDNLLVLTAKYMREEMHLSNYYIEQCLGSNTLVQYFLSSLIWEGKIPQQSLEELSKLVKKSFDNVKPSYLSWNISDALLTMGLEPAAVVNCLLNSDYLLIPQRPSKLLDIIWDCPSPIDKQKVQRIISKIKQHYPSRESFFKNDLLIEGKGRRQQEISSMFEGRGVDLYELLRGLKHNKMLPRGRMEPLMKLMNYIYKPMEISSYDDLGRKLLKISGNQSASDTGLEFGEAEEIIESICFITGQTPKFFKQLNNPYGEKRNNTALKRLILRSYQNAQRDGV